MNRMTKVTKDFLLVFALIVLVLDALNLLEEDESEQSQSSSNSFEKERKMKCLRNYEEAVSNQQKAGLNIMKKELEILQAEEVRAEQRKFEALGAIKERLWNDENNKKRKKKKKK